MKFVIKKYLNKLSLTLFVVFYLTISNTSFAKSNIESIILKDNNVNITHEEAQLLFDSLTPPQQNSLTQNKEKLKKLLLNVLTHKKLSQQAIKQQLDKDRLTKWRINKAKNTVLIESLIQSFKSNIVIPENLTLLAKEYYIAHPIEFTRKERVKAAHILLKTRNKDDAHNLKQLKLANEILKKLKAGSDFSELAKEYSEDSTASSGGDLGYFTRGKMTPKFEEAAFSLEEINSISDIVTTPFGYHIIKLLERTPKSKIPFEEVKQSLLESKVNSYIGAEVSQYLEKFKSHDNTTVFIPALDSFYKELVKNNSFPETK